MEYHNNINKINDNLFISGIIPLFESKNISSLDINLIVCAHACDDDIEELHKDLLEDLPHLKILYLPYEDRESQSLFSPIYLATSNFDIDYNTISATNLADLAVEIIQKENTNTLIHCYAGVSRSAAIAIYYLMKILSYTYDDAFNYLKSVRDIIDPNDGFVSQLSSLNKFL